MGRKIRSARGEMVDFDLLRIQQNIATAEPLKVKTRESYIERKKKFKANKAKARLAVQQANKVVAEQVPPSKIAEPAIEEASVKKAKKIKKKQK